MSRAYYNEYDKYAAQWLRNLIYAGHIAPGDVDERSIEDVRPADLRGYTQCHFFAGIGVWSYALRRAGWSDDRPIWTGSCPCQPFSAAGKGDGFADERHLWPAWLHLISQRKPSVVFGEQVASKDGLAWLDLVHSDMEAEGYAFASVDLCSAGFGAPRIRQRLYFVADTYDAGLEGRSVDECRRALERAAGESGLVSRLADPHKQQRNGSRDGGVRRRLELAIVGDAGVVAYDTSIRRREERSDAGRGAVGNQTQGLSAGLSSSSDMRPGPVNGHWRAADWLFCRDHRFRPVEPGTFPLVDGASARVGRLRAYGNAVNAEVTEEFVRAYLEHDRERAL